MPLPEEATLSETFVHNVFKSYSCEPLTMSIEPVLKSTVPPTPASVPYCSERVMNLPKEFVTVLCVKFEPVDCPCKEIDYLWY